MLATRAPIVVVGASLGGLRAVEALRREGWGDGIVVVGSEPHLPYTRPPLSKALLLEAAGPDEMLAAVQFRLRDSASDVDWILRRTAVSADLARRRVMLDDGTTLTYAGLVVATGLRPRRLAVDGAQSRRHVLRSLEDAQALRQQLVPEARVVVVGAGFIGCEIAMTVLKAGCSVTVVEPLSAPMERVLGAEVGDAVRRHLTGAGAVFAVGRTVAGFEDHSDAKVGVRLDDGTVLAADVVIEAVGSVPNVEWLDGNGLDLTDGVLCAADLAVEGAERVVAVGDVARFPNHRFDGVPRRVEHWQIAPDTAKIAARTLLYGLSHGAGSHNAVLGPLPTFWSDQGDLRLQSYGAPALGDRCVVTLGSLDDLAAGVAVEYLRDGELVAVVSINAPASMQREIRTRVDVATKAERVTETAGVSS